MPKTFGELEIGTEVNFNRPTTADDTDYKVLYHYSDRWGNWTEVLNLETMERDSFTQHTKIENFWSLVQTIN